MAARIYKPARNAMQQGMAPREWVLEYEPDKSPVIEPLMGWTSSFDTRPQVQLRFATKEEAIAYAERTGLAYRVEEPKPNLAARRGVSYSDNFKTSRIGLWTH